MPAPLPQRVRGIAALLLLTACPDEDVAATTGPGSSTGASSSTGEPPATTGADGSDASTDAPTPTTSGDASTGTTDDASSTGPAAVCGDGVVDAGEGCDDADDDDSDECPSSCAPAFCGDGFVRADAEACDDGNKYNNDACTNTCTVAVCGDGVVHEGVEACDDGNAADDDWCTACAVAVCGDGVVHAGFEGCDDGNAADDDACRGDCTPASCGDGVVQEGVEGCDDGDGDDDDACTSLCLPAACGDGFVYAGVEGCDDGNAATDDACVACAPAACGDGFVYAGVEGCDDGNEVATDACSDLCAPTPKGLALAPGADTPQYGGLDVGAPFVDACPAGQALVGFTGATFGGAHGKLSGLCSPLQLAVAGDAFVVQTGAKTALPSRGDTGNVPWLRECPAPRVVVGFSGRAGVGVDRLVFACAELVVSEAMDGSFSVAPGPAIDLAGVGGNGGAPFPPTSCPPGQVATAQRVRASAGVDAFGLGCSAAALTF
jgi:cysteine-rich repeat protein